MPKNSKSSQSKDKKYFTSDNTLLENFGTVKVTKSPEEVVGTILKFIQVWIIALMKMDHTLQWRFLNTNKDILTLKNEEQR